MATTDEQLTLSRAMGEQPKPERRSLRPYPLFSVNDAAEVAMAIVRFNGGNPWPPPQVALSLNMGPRTPRFYYLTAAARDYGLTIGTRDANRIEVTDLGGRLALASDPNERHKLLLNAFLNVPIFRRVYDYYHGDALPSAKYVTGTLTSEFGLDSGLHDEFLTIYRKNYEASTIGHGATHAPAVSISPAREPAAAGPTGSAAAIPEGCPCGETPAVGAVLIAVPSDPAANFPPGFFGEVRESLLLPALQEASLDGSFIDPTLSAEMVQALANAPLVIVDVSAPDAAGYFAAGLRMGLGKPVVFVHASETAPALELPAGIAPVAYNRSLWRSTLGADIPSLSDRILSAL